MKPLDCNELVEMITAYLDGSLDLETRARFDEHLLDCDGCDNYLQRSVRWHVEYGGNPALAATATDAITVLTDPATATSCDAAPTRIAPCSFWPPIRAAAGAPPTSAATGPASLATTTAALHTTG